MPTNGLVWQISCSKHVNAGRYSWALASCLRATATPENADKKFADTVRSQIAGITRAVNDYNLLSFFSSFGGVVSVADGTPEFSGIVLIDESATGQGVVNPDGSITNRLVQDLLGGGYRDILSTCKMARAHDGLYEFCEPWQRNNAFSPETQKKLDETAAKIRRGR